MNSPSRSFRRRVLARHAVIVLGLAFPLLGCQRGDIFELAHKGRTGKIETLLSSDPGLLFSRDPVGRTPLHLAAMEGRVDSVRLLLEKGMDPGTPDRVGFTAIDYARIAGDSESVGLLEDQATLPEAIQADDLALMRKIVSERPDSVDEVSPDGTVPLHLAVDRRDVGTVDLLFREGASPNVPYPNGESPLQRGIRNDTPEIVRLLLAAGADPNHLDRRGRSPLYDAIEKEDLQTVQSLLEKGANPNLEMTEGLTPIQIAAQKGSIPIVEELINRGGAIDATNDGGRDALYWAGKHHHYRLARLIEKMIEAEDD